MQERTPDTPEVPSRSSQQEIKAAPGTEGAVEGYVTRRRPWLSDHKTAAEEPSRSRSSSGTQHAPSSADGKQLSQVAEASAQQEKRVRFAPTAATRQAQVEEVGEKRPTSSRDSESIVKETVQERGVPANGAHQPLLPRNFQDFGSFTEAAPHTEQQPENGAHTEQQPENGPHTEQQPENGAARQQTVVLGFGDGGGTMPGCQAYSPRS